MLIKEEHNNSEDAIKWSDRNIEMQEHKVVKNEDQNQTNRNP